MYLFDPTQFSELGYNFYKGDGFTCRYQLSKKIFFKSMYIPLGPNCESQQGFDNFIDYIKSQKFTKVKIDLPTIYESKKVKEVTKKLKLAGFKKTKYIQDEETLIVTPEDLNLPHSEMTQVRYGLKRADIVIKNNITDEELDASYKVYKVATKRLGVQPKDKSVFRKLSENCQIVLAYEKDTKNLEGFLLNYFVKTELTEISNKSDGKLMLAMYTGLTDKGRDLRLGRAIYYESFRTAFDNKEADVIDFHGASRSKGRSYMGFKLSFSKRFISLPGSFEKIRFF
jgi:hypothetical protein